MRAYLTSRLFRDGVGNVTVRSGHLPDGLAGIAPADGIVAIGVLDYARDARAALAALVALGRPSAWIVATVPSATPSADAGLARELVRSVGLGSAGRTLVFRRRAQRNLRAGS